jgi:hypothetical protein
MQDDSSNYLNKCGECELPAQEHLNYFTGQFLAERDFRDEQTYHIGKHRQHNRFLHGWGTVCGLRVVQHPNEACRDRFVMIEPGLALDCCGREIVVRDKVYVDLDKHLAAQNGDADANGDHLLISLCYKECKTEFVPALYSECGCDEERCEANRVREGFEVEASYVDQLPESPVVEAVGVNLDWTTTLNLKAAVRVALDPDRNLLYVLTAESGQLLVYDTDHYCLLRSVSIEGTGVDLAIAPNGDFLYIVRFIPPSSETTGNYFLRVLDWHDLETPITINDLPLSDGRLEDQPPQVFVAAEDGSGKVYVLDPNASPNKKVIIWTDSVNTSGAASTFAEFQTGDDPRAIAVSPDGAWLFIAEAADTDNHVKAIKVETLTSTPVSDYTIDVPEKPILLATSGDSQRVFVATANNRLRAFRIQEGDPPDLAVGAFPEIGAGVDLGADALVALAASPAGKWVYVLTRDSENRSWVQVVNIGKLDATPDQAVGEAVAVIPDGQDMLLDPNGRSLYTAGLGRDDELCGGVSVLDVNEEACREILWRTLEGCPDCPEDLCVPLAAVRDYTYGMVITDREIDNRIRPLAPSTETLKQLILCALESCASERPEVIDSGVKSADAESVDHDQAADADFDPSTGNIHFKIPKGEPGADGIGLEEDLTQIVALSWRHNKGKNPLISVTRITGRSQQFKEGIVIGFSKPVFVSFPTDPANYPPSDYPRLMDAEHVFQVLIQDVQGNVGFQRCFCPVIGTVIPVDFKLEEAAPLPGQGEFSVPRRIVSAQEIEGPMARGAAFIFDDANALDYIQETNELRVRLHGDFVIDNDKPDQARAIDAEFVRGELPSGDRPRDNKFGIQGGLFESWFWIGDRPQARPPQ